jgi:fucose permease
VTTRTSGTRVLLGLSFLAFVSLGLPDGVLGVAWPSIRGSFELPLDALGALLVTATAGYVASSFSSGWLLARMSVGTLLAASCALTAASLLGYAAAPAWGAMIAMGLLAGLGAGAIDSGLNTHVATHHGARTLNLLHACYGLGTTTGPILMTAVLMAGSPWRRGYAILGAAQLALALCFLVTRRRWPHPPGGGPMAVDDRDARERAQTAAADSHPLDGMAPAPLTATLRLPTARLGVAAFFLYVGLEASAGAWIYSLLHEARALSTASAGAAVSVYWGGLLVGRLVFGLTPDALHPRRLPSLAVAVAAGGAGMLAMATSAPVSLVAAAILGAGFGPVFPSLIASTSRRLGPAHAANGVGFQIAAAAIGQSLLPALAGVAAGRVGLEVVPVSIASTAILLLGLLQALDRFTVSARDRPGARAGSATAAPTRAPSRRT